jgi:YesN/AraC family two-component response regulator
MREEAEKKRSQAVFLPHERFGERISDRTIAYMQDHIRDRLDIEKICQALHYNKSYIFKQFKKTTNCSIMEYFIRLKVDKSKELLRETSMSIGEISSYLSFDTPNYFSKTFKKITGYTPTTYRKLRRQGK